MLLTRCRKLHSFYLDAVHTINSLESVGKPYRWGRNREYYFESLEFYRMLLESKPSQRMLQAPKIFRDSAKLKKHIDVLEKNKHELIVYSTLGNVGDPHWNIGTFYR